MKQLTKRLAIVTAAGLFALAFAMPQNAEACGGRGRFHRGKRGAMKGKRVERLAKKLNLDAATKGQIKQLFVQARAQGKVLRQRLRAQRKGMRQLMQQPNPNEAQVLAKVESMGKLKVELKKLRVKTRLAMLQLLTPDQRSKLQSLRAQRRAKRKARREAFRKRMMQRYNAQ